MSNLDDLETPVPSDQQSSAAPRSGKARERHLRRQQRQAAMATPIGARSAPRQISPAGRVKLPTITLPKNRLPFYVIGGMMLVGVVIIMLAQFFGNEAPTAPPNAIWLGTEWTYNLDTDAQVSDLVNRLRRHKIGTVYAWVSWLKSDGTWGGKRDGTNQFEEVETTVKEFVQEFHTLYPEATLYGWVSLPAAPSGTETYRLNDTEVQQTVADFSQRVLDEFEFDGVFLNVEPVWDGDENFLALLRKVRAALGDEAVISAVIPPDWSPRNAAIPVPPLVVPGTEWSVEYKQSVALLVNQMAVMAYNSGLSNPNDYATWVAYQVKAYAEAVAGLDAGTLVMIGIPTYDSELPGHDALIENIPSALEGVKLGLQQAGDAARFVQGVAIYAEWTTDDAEWGQFDAGWIAE